MHLTIIWMTLKRPFLQYLKAQFQTLQAHFHCSIELIYTFCAHTHSNLSYSVSICCRSSVDRLTDSLPANPRSQCQRPPSLPRVDASEAISRKDQGC